MVCLINPWLRSEFYIVITSILLFQQKCPKEKAPEEVFVSGVYVGQFGYVVGGPIPILGSSQICVLWVIDEAYSTLYT